MIYDMVLRKIM